MADDTEEKWRKQTKLATKREQSLHNIVTNMNPKHNRYVSDTCKYDKDKNSCKKRGRGDSSCQNVQSDFHENMFSPLEESNLQTEKVHSENIYSSNNPRIIGSSPQLKDNSKLVQVEVEGYEDIENDDNDVWKKVEYKRKRLFQSCKNDDEKEKERVVRREHKKGKEVTEKVKERDDSERDRRNHQSDSRKDREVERGSSKAKRNQRSVFNPVRPNEPSRVVERREIIRVKDKCVICSDSSIIAAYFMSKIVFCLCNVVHNHSFSDIMSKNMSDEERRKQEKQFEELVQGIETWPEDLTESQFPTPAEAAALAKKTKQRTVSNASTASAPGSAPVTPLPQRSNVRRLRHNCSECEEKFGLKSELTEHMKSVHGINTPQSKKSGERKGEKEKNPNPTSCDEDSNASAPHLHLHSNASAPIRVEMTKSQVDKGGKYFKPKKENK